MFTPLSIPIVDGHVHLVNRHGIGDMLELSNAAGIERINIVCVPGTPERSLSNNSAALLAKGLYPASFYVFGGLVYNIGEPSTAEGFQRQAENLRAMGCEGMKMLEGKPTSRKRIPFRMDDPVYDRYYAFLQETGFPIVWHVADPGSFWDPARITEETKKNGWDYTDGTFPSKEQLYGEVDRVLEKFPRLRIIFAHFYFLSNQMERSEQFLERWPNVSFDITPGSEMYRNFSKDPARWRDFFIKHQDRIIFGTDNATPREPREKTFADMTDKIRMMRQFLETKETFEGFGCATSRHVTGIGLEQSVLEKIYRLNFERYAGSEPQPLNIEPTLRHCRHIREYARATAGQETLYRELTEIEKNIQQL